MAGPDNPGTIDDWERPEEEATSWGEGDDLDWRSLSPAERRAILLDDEANRAEAQAAAYEVYADSDVLTPKELFDEEGE